MKTIKIKDFAIGDGSSLVVMCGPCVIEGEDFTLKVAERLKKIFMDVGCKLIFKSSYDKANRTAKDSFRGPGLEKGLKILERVKKELDLPIVTDIHSIQEAEAAAQVVDILQIPAFLCRQTDLVMAAGRTGAIVSIKKGQFLAPWDMKQVVEKVLATGNDKIISVERGASFGYNNLVSDMRSIPIMQKLGYPVCYDASHSVQLPGSLGGQTGGDREFIPLLAASAVAAGVDCLFMEAHPDPASAKSDAASQMLIDDLPKLLTRLQKIFQAVRA